MRTQLDYQTQRSKSSGSSTKRRLRRQSTNAWDSFAPGRWVNDAGISAMYSIMSSVSCGQTPWLSQVQRPCRNLKAESRPETFLFIEPAVAFWLAAGGGTAEERDEAVTALALEKRDVILCPVNDSTVCSKADSGNHWSLLVGVIRSDRSGFNFLHYDSGGRSSSNLHHAKQLAAALTQVPPSSNAPIVQCRSCPRQANSFDCGVYVLCLSSIIIDFLLSRGGHFDDRCVAEWEAKVVAVKPSEVTEFRTRCWELVRREEDRNAALAVSHPRGAKL